MSRRRKARRSASIEALSIDDPLGGLSVVDQDADLDVSAASSGDHHEIRQLLKVTRRSLADTDFQAQLEAPDYHSSDRLVARWNGRLAAHCWIVNRQILFGDRPLSVGRLVDFTVLPEHHHHGCAAQLLAAVEQELADRGVHFGWVATDHPRFFAQRGWTICTRHSYVEADPRAILARFRTASRTERPLWMPPPPRAHARVWRRVELASIMARYEQFTRGEFGPVVRDTDHWEWLIRRQAFDRIYVAVRPEEDRAGSEPCPSIVGYAVARDDAVLELMADPDHESDGRQLLARVCRDAIERAMPTIRLYGPPYGTWHRMMIEAGGEPCYYEAARGRAFAVYVPDLLRLLREMGPLIKQRAVNAGVTLPVRLGLQWNGQQVQLDVKRSRVSVRCAKNERSYLAGSPSTLIRLVLGHESVQKALEDGRLEVSTKKALALADVLFPPVPYWTPPWDELPAS